MEQKLSQAAERLPGMELDFETIRAASANRKTTGKSWRAIAACAVCIALVLCAGLGSYAYAEEAREYEAAILFFDKNGLSAEGLTRNQIKAVYRDITTKSFTYSKTAEVIRNSLSAEQNAGFEIWQEEPTPEDVENLWNYKNYNGWFVTAVPQTPYTHRSEFGDVNGRYGHEKSYVEKHNGDSLVWSTAITEFWVKGCCAVSDGVIAYGEDYTWSSEQKACAWMAKLDQEGNLRWIKKMDNGFHDEWIEEVLENPDGSYAVFSRGDFDIFCLSQYTADGQRTLFHKTEIGNYGIWNAARFGDGYIVQLGSYIENEYARIAKVDHEGNITDVFSYSSQEAYYYFTDMIEYNGKVYISAYATPRLGEDENTYGGREEIARVLDYVYSRGDWDISSEELTPVVRENFTAMLLVFAPYMGSPKGFYSVEGSLGGELEISEDGQLLWDVESITTTFYSPATNAFTIGGTCYVYRYTFGENGVLISREKTDQVKNFGR